MQTIPVYTIDSSALYSSIEYLIYVIGANKDYYIERKF